MADGIEFPNGMVVTPDNSTLIISESFAGRLTAFDIADDGSLSNRRVWADGVGPDGICIDADGAIWVDVGDVRRQPASAGSRGRRGARPDRARPGLLRLHARRRGPQTLFMLAADWRMSEGFAENIERLTQGPRTGQLLTAPAPARGVGRP